MSAYAIYRIRDIAYENLKSHELTTKWFIRPNKNLPHGLSPYQLIHERNAERFLESLETMSDEEKTQVFCIGNT